MKTDWRISTFNGALLAAYFIPAWTIVAFKIMISPVHGLYDRPNIAVAIFMSDYLHLASLSTARMAWLLALGKMTVVAFFAVFVFFTTRATIRKTGGCDEALSMALAIGGLISFVSMVMASRVGEIAAMRLHAAELLMMVGGIVLMAVEPTLLRRPSPATSETAHQSFASSDYPASNPSS